MRIQSGTVYPTECEVLHEEHLPPTTNACGSRSSSNYTPQNTTFSPNDLNMQISNVAYIIAALHENYRRQTSSAPPTRDEDNTPTDTLQIPHHTTHSLDRFNVHRSLHGGSLVVLGSNS
ncbi:hypothetical protein TNCV_5098671 [Trichonephila clavipes]|uniref:Uncharacterized protein n=1 Tax=Trichonephila clavipes TaxID=2585209 RepID=A0A8X6RWM7_TRICX|nr:hypothetical protein TNCV_5098671 [Trichonephila clavipes]